jgi:hypothetical protein
MAPRRSDVPKVRVSANCSIASPAIIKKKSAKLFTRYAQAVVADTGTVFPSGASFPSLSVRSPESSGSWREEFQTVCFNLFILKRALKLTRSVCLRAS